MLGEALIKAYGVKPKNKQERRLGQELIDQYGVKPKNKQERRLGQTVSTPSPAGIAPAEGLAASPTTLAPSVSPAAFGQPILDAAKQAASLAQQQIMQKQEQMNAFRQAVGGIAAVGNGVNQARLANFENKLSPYIEKSAAARQALETQLQAYARDEAKRREQFLEEFRAKGGAAADVGARGRGFASHRDRSCAGSPAQRYGTPIAGANPYSAEALYVNQREQEYQNLLNQYAGLSGQALRKQAFAGESGKRTSPTAQPGSYTANLDAAAQKNYVDRREQEYLKLKSRVDSQNTTAEQLLSQKEAYTPEQVAAAQVMIRDYEKQHPVSNDSNRRAYEISRMDPRERARFTAMQELKRRVNPLSAAAVGGFQGVTAGFGGMLVNQASSAGRMLEQARAARKQGNEELAKVYEAMARGNEGVKVAGRDARQHPGAYGAGNFVGSGIFYGGAAKAIASMPRVGKAAQAAGQRISGLTGGRISAEVAAGLVSGRIADLPGDITNAAVETIENGDNFYDFVKKLAGDQATGLLMDGSIEMLSAGYRMIKQKLGKGTEVRMAAPMAPQNLRDLPNQNPEYWELIKESPIEIVNLPKTGKITGIKDARQAALEAFKSNEIYKQPIINKQTGVSIFVNAETIKHSCNNLAEGFENISQIEILPQLIENAHFIGRNMKKATDTSPTFGAAYTLLSATRDEVGNIFPVKLTVKEFNVRPGEPLPAAVKAFFDQNGARDAYSRLYDSKFLVLDKIKGSVPVSHQKGTNFPVGEIPSTNPIISVQNLIDSVKGDAKKYMPTPDGPGTHQANAPVPPQDRMPPPTQGDTGGGGGGMSAKEANDLAGQQFAGAAIEGLKKGGLEQQAAREANAQAGKRFAEAVAQGPQASAVKQGVEDFGKNTVGAAQAADVPERKVSKLYSNSFEKTPLFNEAEKNAAHLRRLDKSYSYDEITEKRSLQEAAMRVQTDKAGELADLPVKGEWGGSDVDTAMLLMEDMLKTARQTKNYDDVLKWTKMIQEKATVAGQEIQAFAKYSRTPEGAAVKAQKVVAGHWKKLADTDPNFVKAIDGLAENLSKIAKEYAYDMPEDPIEAARKLRKAIQEVCADGNIKLDQTGQEKILRALLERHEGKDVYEDVLKELESVPVLTGEEINQIMDIMSEAEKFPLYSKRRAEIENQANCIVASKFSSNWAEKCTAWRYMAMLGNPRTHIRNVVGNGFFGELTKAKNAVGALLEGVTDKAPKNGIQRTKAILNPFNKGDQALKKAAKADYEDYWALVAGTGKYNPADAIRDNKRIFKNNALEKSRKFVSGALETEDNWALRARYSENMASYLKANKFNADVFKSNSPIAKDMLDKARAYAIDQAQKATFRDASMVASALNKFSNSSKAAHIVVEGTIPFKKTPINIVKRGIEYSPIGVVQGVGRAFNAVRKGKYNASDAIEKIASGLTGSGIMALGGWLAYEGVLTGAGSPDGRERAFDTLTGGQNYALVIGDKRYSLEWASPAALPLFVGVELQKAWTAKRGEYGFSEFMDALTKISEPVLDMTMLQGLNDTLQTAAYNQTNALAAIAGSAATNYITQFVPSSFGQAARTADATRRSTTDDKTNGIPGFIEKPARAVMAKTPGLSYLLEPGVDQWGREKKNAGGNVVGRLALNTVSPGFYSRENKTPVDLEIERLYKKTGKKEILPNYANKYVMIDGKRRDLNAKEYTQFTREQGQNAFKTLGALFQSDHYKGMDEEKQVETIQDVYTYAGDLAANKVVGKELKGLAEKAKEAEGQGISPDKLILYRNVLKDLKTSAEKNRVLLEDNTTNEEKKALYLAFVPGSGEPVQKAKTKIQAFQTAGLDMNDFLKMSVKYAEIDGPDTLSPQGKTTRFCKWLDTQGLSEKQYQTARENFKYFSMFPAKPEAYKVDFASDKKQAAFQSLQSKYKIKESDFMRGVNAADAATSDKDINGKTVNGSKKKNMYVALRKIGWDHATAKVFMMEVYGSAPDTPDWNTFRAAYGE